MPEENAKSMIGTVRSFDDSRGYGFIRVEGVPEDIFVHHQSIKMSGFRSLSPGDTVEFRIARDEKGWKARDVVRVSPAGQKQAESTKS